MNSEANLTPQQTFEVPNPIINSPYDEPGQHWWITRNRPPELRTGRRPAGYFYLDPDAKPAPGQDEAEAIWVDLTLVNRIRGKLKEWRASGYSGATRTTIELLDYWRREERERRLFFAQIEAAETIIFLNEARGDFLQGINVPLDGLSEEKEAEGYRAFLRNACKMATGAGKTTVMAMLAAWSILNKVTNRSEGKFSDAVLVVCPNVTIRNRLGEIDPQRGDASLYRTRDIVPEHLMNDLRKGAVMVVNWHIFEPQEFTHRASRKGVPRKVIETIHIAAKPETARGKRYLTLAQLEMLKAAGRIRVLQEERDKAGNLKLVKVESTKYMESDTALLKRVLKEIGGRSNILVFNDEAHHAYRIARKPEENGSGDDEDGDDWEEEQKEATVWVEGLDKVNKNRGINFVVDLSATPYYLGRVGQQENRTFPWVVSDFGLTDAIESGLVKIPQLVVRDTTGAEIPGYYNIWRWVQKRLTPAERGAKKESPKPEAVLKHASHPIAILSGYWEELRKEWEVKPNEPRPPVLILVCKNTKLAKMIYEWIADGKPPPGIPKLQIETLRNQDGKVNTIRVDSKVVHETDSGQAKTAETAWMRFTLDTVGRQSWSVDKMGSPIYPEGFEELSKKLNRPLTPPGKDVRCIISVGMLTEGWDCTTVTHILGLRPFMSQLLCEQVAGRALRRSSYQVDGDGKMTEEVAKIFGVPFEIIPFKASSSTSKPTEKRNHIYAIPGKEAFKITFPRVAGYRQAIRNKIMVDWDSVPTLILDPLNIPPEVEMKASVPNNLGRPTLHGPGSVERVDLNPYRHGFRLQKLVFTLATDLTRDYASRGGCEIPTHVLFPQVAKIVDRYLQDRVKPLKPANIHDVFLAPYYGFVIERLLEAIRPDTTSGETPEVPVYEMNREPGSTSDVDAWTSRETRDVLHSHLNAVVADTAKWEESAAYYIDTHPATASFVKNAFLGFGIPYFDNGQAHEYQPDFIVHVKSDDVVNLILETKGYDPKADIKKAAAIRWVDAVNADGQYGKWAYRMVKRPEEVTTVLAAQT